ncbi:hypothetical protein SLEP1_g33707 [Rubroshorea leprosula]|uniref:Eukaryotic translation initiation factor 4B3-like n=1 Tax=Rubroshorea leprosula TaxID=152421 RepID=A0AAV5KHG1_9ROSI|nr:hypothetical protein SLEP1_g33707 [Rubroshorea leprosula]
MAATVSSPWGKPGAWALDAEEHEAELQQQKDQPNSALPTKQLTDFPSLSAAAATKTKKKKGQTLTLAEFNTHGADKSSQPSRLTHDEILTLPTGPRQRSSEELDRNRLGGGFKSYGSNRYNSNGDDSSNRDNNRWGSSRVSNRESNRELPPSRADEIDNWASAKKSNGNGNGFGGGFDRRERGERGGFFDSQSKADEDDNWVLNKSNNNGTEPPRRFVGGFERRNSFDSLQSRDSPRDSDNWGKKKEESGSGGVRPRIFLQPRTVPLNEEGKRESPAAKPKGSNPFGEARPREEVLAEKGKDWKEIDEKLEAVKHKEVVSGAERGDRGRSSFGLGNGRASAERSWRKNESAAAKPQSEEKTDNGNAAEN